MFGVLASFAQFFKQPVNVASKKDTMACAVIFCL